MRPALFKNRIEAGDQLAAALDDLAPEDPLILALPRGGVPVAFEIARRLDAPLDVLIVRKLGVPGQEELAMGAVASGGLRVFNRDVLDAINVPPLELARALAHEEDEIERRERAYRGGRAAAAVEGRVVVVVDDGLATGSTMLAAVRTLRTHAPERIVVAVPVSPAQTIQRISDEADEVFCLHSPEPFLGVGLWYDDFTQTTDEEVRSLLAAARAFGAERPRRSEGAGDDARPGV